MTYSKARVPAQLKDFVERMLLVATMLYLLHLLWGLPVIVVALSLAAMYFEWCDTTIG